MKVDWHAQEENHILYFTIVTFKVLSSLLLKLKYERFKTVLF